MITLSMATLADLHTASTATFLWCGETFTGNVRGGSFDNNGVLIAVSLGVTHSNGEMEICTFSETNIADVISIQ